MNLNPRNSSRYPKTPTILSANPRLNTLQRNWSPKLPLTPNTAMPPRLPLPAASGLSRCLPNLRIPPTPPPRLIALFTTTHPLRAQKEKSKHRDKESIAASEKRRLANIARQSALKQQRLSTAADPIVGFDTSFLKSLETPPPLLPPVDWALTHDINPQEGHSDPLHLNHFLTPEDLAKAIEKSQRLTAPAKPVSKTGVVDTYIEPEKVETHQREHDNAVAAIQRIVSLSLGSNADKQRVNTIRCINTFGRHITDKTLPADPNAPDPKLSKKTPRCGPDTGSSEVQAAILTVKIRNLAKMLKGYGHKDKHNKRNLMLLVHRRQKLLKYLKRKEKGGVRYRNIMDALGLDEAAVMKEFSI